MRRISLVVTAAAAVMFQSSIASANVVGDAQRSEQSVHAVLADIEEAVDEQPLALRTEDGTQTDAEADLPVTGTRPTELSSASGTLVMDIPAIGRDLAPADSTALFEGADPDTSVAVQSSGDGVRALIHIDSAEAPERFDFVIGGDVVRLRFAADGAVDALDADGSVVATAAKPWATDADGTPVPTHYEIDGNTLTQVVEHRAGTYVYGIVADPWWNPFSWDWGKILKKTVSAVAKALKNCGEGALGGALTLAIGTGTTNVLITKVGSSTALVRVGGVYGYIGVAAAGCVLKLLS